MRKIFAALLILAATAAPAHADAAPERLLAEHLQQMQAANPGPGVVTSGAVSFVTGNDLWQPGTPFHDGGDWLALSCDAAGCRLEAASLSVVPESWQGHYDDAPTQGQRLSFRREHDGTDPVVAWFHTLGAPAWLQPGPVAGYHTPLTPWQPAPGDRTLEAAVPLPGGDSVRLVPLRLTEETMRRLLPDSRHSAPSYLLQLRTPQKRQLLLGAFYPCFDYFTPTNYLPWVGDLDRDGAADYLINFADQDGPVHLYLSGAARPAELVGLAGVYVTPPFGGECEGGF